MSARREYWNTVYTTKAESSVSWFQLTPEPSLSLIHAAAPGPHSAIIDIGGGASHLTDALLSEGRTDLTVLDVSEAGLQRTQARLGARAADVTWIAADVTAWRPTRTWAAWHDRAVLHFLVERAEQDAYLAALHAGTKAGAAAILFTFALDGPERCSGLPVQRYSPATLAARVGPEFVLEAQGGVPHRTPSATEQSFAYAVLRRR